MVAKSGFQRAAEDLAAEQPSKAAIETSLRTARTWLREARQPLVVLSGSVDNETASAAVRLAKQYSAFLTCDEDATGSVLGGSIQAAGLLTGTLGDLRSLDLVVLCGVDLAGTPPRLGEFLGRDLATASLCLEPPAPLEALRWLRLAGMGEREQVPAAYAEPAARLEAASSGVVVFGSKWLKNGLPFTTEFLLWLKDLNRNRHWYALYLPPAPNSTGVVDVLVSETGYPGNLRFGSQGAEYSPRLWQAERLIRQGETDLCLLVGQPASFSEKTLGQLSRGRTILLDPFRPAWTPAAWLPCAQTGVDSSGLIQRMDGLPLALRSILSSQRISIQDLVLELAQGEPA